jgi:hypothetical protein
MTAPRFFISVQTLWLSVSGQFNRIAFSSATNAVSFSSARNNEVICIYDEAGAVVETLEHAGDFKQW